MSWNNVVRAATLACLGLPSCGPANGSPQHPAGHDASDAALGGAGGAGAGGDGSTMPPISFESPMPPTCDPRLLAASRLCESNATSCPVSTGLAFNCRGSVEHVDMFAASDIDVYFAVNVASTDGNPEVPRAHAVFLIERHGDEIAVRPGPNGGRFCRVRLLAGEPVMACDSDTGNVQLALPDADGWQTEAVGGATRALAGLEVGDDGQVYVLVYTYDGLGPPSGLDLHTRDAQGSWTSRVLVTGTPITNVAIGRDAASQVAVAVWTPDGELQNLNLYAGDLPAQSLVMGSANAGQLEVHPHGSGALVFTRLGGTAYVPGDAGYAQHSLLPGPESFVSDCPTSDSCAGGDITCTTRGTRYSAGSLALVEGATHAFIAYRHQHTDSQAHVSNCSPTCSCTSQTLRDDGFDEIVIARVPMFAGAQAEVLHTMLDPQTWLSLVFRATEGTLHLLRESEYRALPVAFGSEP